jgi:hypothetical protein
LDVQQGESKGVLTAEGLDVQHGESKGVLTA